MSNIPLSKIKAVIFDMDELMVNSATVHKEVIEQVLNTYGVSLYDPKDPFTKEEEANWYGLKIIDIFENFRKRYLLEEKTTADEMNHLFNAFLLPTFATKVPVMPGVIELIDSLHGKYKLAIASSAPRAKIDIVTEKLNATDAFEVIVSGEDEEFKSKPAPDMYLAAARRLGIDPGNCLVLEDAKHGVDAAKNAGMYCIGVHNKFTFEEIGKKQDLSSADMQVESLLEVIPILDKSKVS